MLALGDGATAAKAQESTLQIGSGGSDIAALDPHRATTTMDKPLIGLINNGLVRFAPGSADPKDLEPDLAERWECSADGKTWTFYLRKGVKFHGSWGELTADDVVYSLTRAGDARRSTFAADFSAVESIAKLDDYAVRIALKYPDPNFLGRSAFLRAVMSSTVPINRTARPTSNSASPENEIQRSIPSVIPIVRYSMW
jgi:peptide/nickel transport system substrate-binding protein